MLGVYGAVLGEYTDGLNLEMNSVNEGIEDSDDSLLDFKEVRIR